MRITRVGGPTVFIELDGWRILVDPTFDPPGRRYRFALGTSSVKPILSPYDADMGGDTTIDGVTVTALRAATPHSPRRAL
jgi:L-ascorbate metabolism protein UlaG (beta-lactamase superfamily)